MTDQPSLFADPVWTDRWQPGDRCRDTNLGHEGTVTAVVAGVRIHVKWTDHPRWGTYSQTYAGDRLLERLA